MRFLILSVFILLVFNAANAFAQQRCVAAPEKDLGRAQNIAKCQKGDVIAVYVEYFESITYKLDLYEKVYSNNSLVNEVEELCSFDYPVVPLYEQVYKDVPFDEKVRVKWFNCIYKG
ncbi:MAG: hypothetical protein K9G62_06915 [Alphaproteobacteria bacterium]|nr:hypothetical protein [Alphaproteobacteria bacterium]